LTLTLRHSLHLSSQSKKQAKMVSYSVKQLAKLAGVSVRTLHLYDQIGLLKPSARTEARYRMYGEKELLRLQQILFYKELDFPLQEICRILDDANFDLIQALESHKEALQSKQNRIATLLSTIDKTMVKLKNGVMLKHEELYEGLPKEKTEAYRNEAIDKYGTDVVERSENQLRKMSKQDFAELIAESKEITKALLVLVGEDPTSEVVQRQIARHYQSIRMFWGTAGLPDTQAEAYKGLGDLYVNDERYTMNDGKTNPDFVVFMRNAMSYFADTQLK
jgi:DNA-binding transcriptional MerR regulator